MWNGEEDIKKSLSKLYSDSFVANLVIAENPYGDVGSSDKIHKIIKNIELEGLLKKSFFQGNRIEA